MIRLALAVGFLAVFGLVAYAIVLLLTNYFQKQKNTDSKENNQNLKQNL
ncbi:hypothetical protein BH09BAC3_BH09BAC3_26590 [soil metagenome]